MSFGIKIDPTDDRVRVFRVTGHKLQELKHALQHGSVFYFEDLMVYINDYGALTIGLGCYQQSMGYNWLLHYD